MVATSNKQQLLGLSVAALLTLSSLSAKGTQSSLSEQNAFYVGAGFQYSNYSWKWKWKWKWSGTYYGNESQSASYQAYGVDVRGGYKQFFGERKKWGARYYGVFSYNYAVPTNLAWGVGADALYNFYAFQNKYLLGAFLGLQLMGSSWLGLGSKAAWKGTGVQTRSTTFQLPINLGFRMSWTQHQSAELGVLIPIVPSPSYNWRYSYTWYDGTTTSYSVSYRRNVSIYLTMCGVFDSG
ncbi:outer membrane beta-barrel protein [Helicobacter vulpis]|uniref:outer membrane beta-barrel protein n=1 Tax=Helicobacter vulpis TaxID=2316076 RepID=UPI0013CE2ADC|nr:outer membrane beta-barrel protein [Helicobacter vulpis]